MAEIFGKPFITQEAMHARIRELGKQISRDYKGEDLFVVGVLKGLMSFLPIEFGLFNCPSRLIF